MDSSGTAYRFSKIVCVTMQLFKKVSKIIFFIISIQPVAGLVTLSTKEKVVISMGGKASGSKTDTVIFYYIAQDKWETQPSLLLPEKVKRNEQN